MSSLKCNYFCFYQYLLHFKSPNVSYQESILWFLNGSSTHTTLLQLPKA